MDEAFADKGTEDIFYTRATKDARKTLEVGLHRIAKRKLDQLFMAKKVEDLRAPPGNRLEALQGDRHGFYSIRINEKWRVVFRFEANGPLAIQIVDYH